MSKYINYSDDDDSPEPTRRYKKAAKTVKKSDHAHKYEPCYLVYEGLKHFVTGEYCSICHRLHVKQLTDIPVKDSISPIKTKITQEQKDMGFIAQYNNIPVFMVNSGQKYLEDK